MQFARLALLASVVVAPLALAPAARAQDAAEILLRLDRMEAENRRLNGQVENLSNQVRRLDDQLKKFQSDVDFRFKEAGGGKGAAVATPPAATTPGGAAKGKRSDAFDPAANPSAPGAPKTIGDLAAEATGQPRPVASGGPGTPASLTPGALPSKTDGAPAGTGTNADFDVAQAMLDRGDYEAAEMAFRNFVRSHPRDKLKPDAIFNIGESFYRRNRYREAAEQYLNVTTDHAKSNRAPEAMLKLGMSLRGLGANIEACGTYGEINKKYPNASPALKQAVDRERKRAQCAA